MADDEEQDSSGSRRKASGTRKATQEPTKDTAPTEEVAVDRDDSEEDAVELAASPAGPVTGSAGPVSLDDLSAGAIRELAAELPPEIRNRYIPGTLTVHYAARDVAFPMDGESALRMLAVLAGTSNDMDPIERISDAQRVWLMIDRDDVLGAQWTPNELTVPRRATMDPAGLVDAVA